MPDLQLKVTTREGAVRSLATDEGFTVMQVIRNAGIGELLALCGGSCSCATCHVYVDPAFAERLARPGKGEEELLDTSAFRTPLSRLSCQIVLSQKLDGLHVSVAPEG